MKRICLLCERVAGILERLQLNSQIRPGNIQIPYYLPSEESIIALDKELRAIAKTKGVEVSLIWLDSCQDIMKALEQINGDTIIWPLTDGYMPFLGTSMIGLLRSFGGQVFGSGPMASSASQNKFIQYGLFSALDIDTPKTWLYNGQDKPKNIDIKYIAKPNNLGNNIGIFDDAVDCGWRAAQVGAERITKIFGSKAIIQQYISGLYCRATFIGINRINKNIGVHVMTKNKAYESSDSQKFTTFDAYFEEFRKRDEAYNNNIIPIKIDEAINSKVLSINARAKIRDGLAKLVRQTDFSGVFTVDVIVSGDIPYFIEFNTNPFIRNAALKAYCKEQYHSSVIEVLYMVLTKTCRSHV